MLTASRVESAVSSAASVGSLNPIGIGAVPSQESRDLRFSRLDRLLYQSFFPQRMRSRRRDTKPALNSMLL